MLVQLNVAHMLSVIIIQGYCAVPLMLMNTVPSWESTRKCGCPKGDSIHKHQQSDPFCTNFGFELMHNICWHCCRNPSTVLTWKKKKFKSCRMVPVLNSGRDWPGQHSLIRRVSAPSQFRGDIISDYTLNRGRIDICPTWFRGRCLWDLATSFCDLK